MAISILPGTSILIETPDPKPRYRRSWDKHDWDFVQTIENLRNVASHYSELARRERRDHALRLQRARQVRLWPLPNETRAVLFDAMNAARMSRWAYRNYSLTARCAEVRAERIAQVVA